MTRTRFTIASLLLVFLAAHAQDQGKPIVQVYPRLVSTEGTWRPANPTPDAELVWDSITRIECDKSRGECLLATAEVGFGGFPGIELLHFRIVSWTQRQILASLADPAICVSSSQLVIDLSTKSVSVSDIKSKNPGYNDSCKAKKEVETYTLVNASSEIVRRRTNAEAKKANKVKP